MNVKKIIIGIALISMFLIPVTTQIVNAKNDEIGVKEGSGTITVTTDLMTIKIIPKQAHITWWYGNRTEADEMYKVQLVSFREFTGEDSILDDRTEFLGVPINLINDNWIAEIVEGETELTITVSLLDFSGDADMYLIMHVYNDDTEIEGTDQVVDGLSEIKFDIVVDNWVFSETAKGYAIQTYLTEVQHQHQVSIRNGTLAENGNITRTMQFESSAHPDVVAYFEWAEFANVYDSDTLVDTIDVDTAYFDDLATPPTEAPGFAEGLAHVLLTYPNYGDGYKMVHDPSVGIYEDAFTSEVSLFILPIIGGLIASVAVITLIKRK